MKRRRIVSSLLIVALFLGSAYASAVVASHIDGALLPGNEISSIPIGVPGTQAQVNISVPGMDSDTDGDKRINVLVLGIDWRPELGGRDEDPGRSDSMYVVSIDVESHRASVLGIPRDLWVEVPSVGAEYWVDGRINEAYTTGELTEPGKGPEYAVMTVERNLDVPIDHWVAIDWEGFKTLIDALGGVDVYVEEELFDPRYPDILAAFPGGVVEPGLHHMNGEQALGYSRIRFTERGDLDRIRRQQKLMTAVVRKAVSAEVLTNAVPLYRRYGDAFATDLHSVQVAGLAVLARSVTRKPMEMYSLGDAVYDWVTPRGSMVLLADEEAQASIVRRFLGEPEPTPGPALAPGATPQRTPVGP